jgi:serine/threonine-protein kinase ULK/ATG1
MEIIKSYDSESKKRKSLLKYNNYFIFERNIAFFFNYVVSKIIKLTHAQMVIFSKT